MATTGVQNAGTICQDALEIIGRVAGDEPASADDMSRALRFLDDMLKDWQMDGIKRFTRERISVTVTSATTSYTLADRVLYIETAQWRDSGDTDTWLTRMEASEYDELSDKDSTGRATSFFHDRQREASVLYVWPVLTTAAGETIQLTVQAETEDITATTDTVEIPREGYLAVKYGLAELLLAPFRVRDPAVIQLVTGFAGRHVPKYLAHEREESVLFSPDFQGQ